MRSQFNRLTIKQYISTLNRLPYESDIEYNERRIAIVLGVSDDYVKGLPYSILMDYVSELNEIENNAKNLRVKNKIKIGGKWFKVDHDIMKLTAAQFIDGSSFAKDAQIDLHKFIAVFIKPMTWRFGKVAAYDGKAHKDISDLVYTHMTMKEAQPLLVFFCKVLHELCTHIEIYLRVEVEAILTNSQTNGDILSRLTTSQIEMLQSGNIFLK